MGTKRILIADGEPKHLSLLREVLASGGFAALAVSKGDQAVSAAAVEQPALVIMDTGLPGEIDGFEAIRRIRAFSDVPILLLTPSNDPEDMLRGFALGADDYVTRPYDPRVLLARVRALLKRCSGVTTAPTAIHCGHLVIDPAAQRVTADGAEIYLTETEYNLLLELARNRDRVLMHEHLLKAVWGAAFSTEVAYLHSYIHMLRQKLERDPSQPRLIISRPGIGYMLVAARSDAPEG